MDWDSHRYLEAYFGIPGMGAVLHSINVRLSPEQILFTMNHAEDSVVLIHEDFISLIEPIMDRLPKVKTWILLRDSDRRLDSRLPFACEYEEVLARGSDDYEFPDFDENSMATLFYTTGTTGDPKGVFFSHRQLVLHTLGLLAATGSATTPPLLSSRDVYMPITPMFHVHAWGIPYATTALGVKQVYPGRYDPEVLLSLLVREKVTFSHCVPTILQMLVNSPAAREVDLTGLKIIVGGSALPKGLARTALEMGIDPYSAYGLSETCPLLTIANIRPDKLDADQEYLLDVRTSTGRAVPLVDLKIVSPDMIPLANDGLAMGEIVVRAPWLTQSYFNNPEKGEDLWKDGYLHTGDVANINEEGYVKITDRIKDVIKTGGEWVSSLELESLISQHPAVGEVVVVGVPDPKWGERPMALVVPASGSLEDFPADEVRNFLLKFVEEGAITKYYIPDRIEAVEEIPKTSVGKMHKRVIRHRWAQTS